MKNKFIILLCCVLCSCNTSKKIVYLQDVANGTSEKMANDGRITVQPKDVLSIVVSSKNPELAIAFNLPLMTYQAGSEMMNYMQQLLGYTVDSDGYIDFPILGKLKVAGLTRIQLAEMVKKKLIQEDLIKDPVVTTAFMNFRISVLGEVRNPNMFTISEDQITILEAIGRAGDLTIYGHRENVLVQREKDGMVTFYRVDLRSEKLLKSPVFYLQQNDIVYVEPNKTMAARSRINENKSLGIWISLASLLTSMAVLIFK